MMFGNLCLGNDGLAAGLAHKACHGEHKNHKTLFDDTSRFFESMIDMKEEGGIC